MSSDDTKNPWQCQKNICSLRRMFSFKYTNMYQYTRYNLETISIINMTYFHLEDSAVENNIDFLNKIQ